MKFRILSFTIAVTLLAALAVPYQTAALTPQKHHKNRTRYSIKDLGTLGGTSSFAGGINNKGEVEGFSTLAGDEILHAFLWRRGHMIDLGTLGGPNSVADFRPNNRGGVAGLAETSTPDPFAEDFCFFGTNLICLPFVSWKGSLISLPTLGGNNGQAAGVNDRGQVAGEAETNTADPSCEAPAVFQYLPVIWKKRKVRELPTFAGDSDGSAFAINNRGQVVGFSGNCTTPFHALLWQDNTVIDLGNLGGATNNLALDINNRGQIVGLSNLSDDTTSHAFLWQYGAMTDLGTLPGDVSSDGDGINNKGQVVGGSFDVDGNSRAFLWEHGLMTDLNTLIPADSPLFLLEATGAINSRGQIAGIAMEKSTGEQHAFLATPREKWDSDEEEHEHASSVTAMATLDTANRSVKVVVPEKVRKMMRQTSHRRGSRSMK